MTDRAHRYRSAVREPGYLVGTDPVQITAVMTLDTPVNAIPYR